MASKKKKALWKPFEAFWPAERLIRDFDLLIPVIQRRHCEAHPNNEPPGESDLRSWRESVYETANALVAAGRGDVFVFIEYRVQPDMAPIDVVLAGRHPDGMLSYAAIELKQWSSLGRPDATNPLGIKACSQCQAAGPDKLCKSCALRWVWVPGYGKHKEHPAAQVYNNLLNLRRYHSMFDDRYVKSVAAAYLHNLLDESAVNIVTGVRPTPGVDVPVFTGRDPNGLRTFVTRHFSPESGAEAAQALMICDEAHRLSARPKTGSFAMRKGPESSVEVVVKAARVPVFFIDGDQRLFGDEVWTPEALKNEILNLGAELVPFTLDRVLRSMGSATYDTWLQHLLYKEPISWLGDDAPTPEPFQLYYAETPHEMEAFLQAKIDDGLTARMTAGICWEWEDDSGTVPQVKLPGGWARPWNPGDNPKTPGIPKRHFWATDEGGFAQVGCVHTAQGLEYEWGGVIIGPDLTREADQWFVHREHVLNKANRITDDAELHRAVRNAYGVLMTRSLRGTVLYSVDPETRKLFAALGVSRVPRV